MLVSFYHFYQMNAKLGNFKGTWEEFFDMFKNKKLAQGDWFDFMSGWKDARDDIELLHVQYEDLLKNPIETIQEMSNFLERHLSEDQIKKIAELSRFDKMKDNKMVNLSSVPHFTQPFMRKGTSGQWKEYFTEDQSRYIDNLMEKHFKGSGWTFDS